MRCLFCLLATSSLMFAPVFAHAQSGQSTRVPRSDYHKCSGKGGYPYRQKNEYVLKELDLRPGDVVVDIGAGDGWWTEKMAEKVGKDGLVFASEVDQKKVDGMKEKFKDVPQVKPYRCPTDGTGRAEDSCDLAFLSKTYHHLNKGGHVDYLRHLRQVVKPDGRLCIIERYPELSDGGDNHGWNLSLLAKQAEEAGWMPVRYELLTGTHHYLAIFVQENLFSPQEPNEERSTSTSQPEAPTKGSGR